MNGWIWEEMSNSKLMFLSFFLFVLQFYCPWKTLLFRHLCFSPFFVLFCFTSSIIFRSSRIDRLFLSEMCPPIKSFSLLSVFTYLLIFMYLLVLMCLLVFKYLLVFFHVFFCPFLSSSLYSFQLVFTLFNLCFSTAFVLSASFYLYAIFHLEGDIASLPVSPVFYLRFA